MTARYLLVAEVAEIIRESEDNVRRRCAAGQIKAKRLGGEWRILEDDLTHFMAAPRTGTPRNRLTKRQREQLGRSA